MNLYLLHHKLHWIIVNELFDVEIYNNEEKRKGGPQLVEEEKEIKEY